MEHAELVGIGVRQEVDEVRVDRAEHVRVDADAHRQGQHRGEGERRAAGEPSQRVPDVLEQPLHHAVTATCSSTIRPSNRLTLRSAYFA